MEIVRTEMMPGTYRPVSRKRRVAARRFWGRLWDDLLEGRMRQAERLIRTHSLHHVYWLHTPSAPASGPMTPGKGEPR
jgi:hypothetical protein